MKITKEQFLEYAREIMDVIQDELNDDEFDRIAEIVQQASTEKELNNLLLEYKEQIKQALQIVSKTVGYKLNKEQEKLVRKAIENSRENNTVLMNELTECSEMIKRGITEYSTTWQRSFKYIEDRIERELTPDEVSVVVRIVERNKEDKASLIYELGMYTRELLEKDFKKGIGQNKLHKRLTEPNNKNKNNKQVKKKRRIKGKTTGKKRTGKKERRKKIVAGIIAGTMAIGAGRAVLGMTTGEQQSPIEFSQAKIERLEEEKSDEHLELLRLERNCKQDLNIERVSCQQVRDISAKLKGSLNKVLSTKVNEGLQSKTYEDDISYGYKSYADSSFYYIVVGQEMYTDDFINFLHKMDEDSAEIVKRLLKLEEMEKEDSSVAIKNLENNEKYLEETIKFIKDFNNNKNIEVTDNSIKVKDREKETQQQQESEER